MITIPKSEKLGSILKAARKTAGLSQSEVASELGYSSGQFISNWERGLAAPPVNVIFKLIEMYNMKDEDILEFLISDLRETWQNKSKQQKKKRA